MVILMGVPVRPKTARIWFSRYRWYEKWNRRLSLQKKTKCGGLTPTCVI